MSTTPSGRQFSPARKTRAFEDIAAQIRLQLSKGNFKAGQRLASERELCEQFQVSRNTLREALRSLENAGVLESRKGAAGGAFVMQVNGDAVIAGLSDMYQLGAIEPEELIQARIWIGSAAIRAAASNISAEEIEAMALNIKEAAQAAKDGDFEGRIRINLDFHRMIARATRNGVMVIMTEALLRATHQVIMRVGPHEDKAVPASRRRVLACLAAGDGEGAVREMERQLTRSQKVYVRALSETRR